MSTKQYRVYTRVDIARRTVHPLFLRTVAKHSGTEACRLREMIREMLLVLIEEERSRHMRDKHGMSYPNVRRYLNIDKLPDAIKEMARKPIDSIGLETETLSAIASGTKGSNEPVWDETEPADSSGLETEPSVTEGYQWQKNLT